MLELEPASTTALQSGTLAPRWPLSPAPASRLSQPGMPCPVLAGSQSSEAPPATTTPHTPFSGCKEMEGHHEKVPKTTDSSGQGNTCCQFCCPKIWVDIWVTEKGLQVRLSRKPCSLYPGACRADQFFMRKQVSLQTPAPPLLWPV